MLDPAEWEWLEEHARGRLRPPADRHVAAVPAVARAALPRGLERGGLQRRLGRGSPRALGEQIARRRVDLEHWAAFGASLEPGHGARARGGDGAHGERRRRRSSRCRATSITPTWPRSGSRPGRACASAVYQATCSPFRNPLDEQRAAHDPLRLRAGGNACRARCWRASRRRRGPAGPLAVHRTTRRTSTTRSASSSSTAAARGCGCRRPPRARTTGYSLETVFERRADVADRAVQRRDRGMLLEVVADDGRVALGGEERRGRQLLAQGAGSFEGSVPSLGLVPGGGDARACARGGGIHDDGDPLGRPRRRRLGGGGQAGDEAGQRGDDELGHTYERTTYDVA